MNILEENKDKNLLVVDMEFSCWKGRPPQDQHQEIISIGICKLDLSSKEILAEKSFLIKNVLGDISYFCTEITGIEQEDIDNDGVELEVAFKEIASELVDENTFAWTAWGNQDQRQLMFDLRRKKLDNVFPETFFDSSILFSKFTKNKTSFSLSNAVEYLGVEYYGYVHQAMDDAINLSNIIKKLY